MGFFDFIPIVGDIIEGVSSAKQSRRERRFMADQAANAHQTEVKDLRKAGLNPILSATGGSGSQAGGYSQPITPNLSDSLSSAIQLKKQRELLDAQIDQAKAGTDNTKEDTYTKKINNDYLEWETAQKMGTGGKTSTYPADKQRADIAEAVQRVAESQQRVTSARETTRKEKLLNDALASDPALAKWVLSASKQEYETIDRALSDARTPSDVVKAIRAILK